MKNLGRYPDRETSLAHNKLSQDRLAEVSLTDDQIINVIDSLTHNYVTTTQVDAEAQTKLEKITLLLDGNLYVDNSQIGSSYASLSNGTLPANQRPNHSSVNYLETAWRNYSANLPSAVNSYYPETSAGSFSVSDPGYAWIPIIHGSVEVNSHGNAPAIIVVKDNEGRLVAGGIGTRSGNFDRLNILPERLNTAYLGSRTFYIYLHSRDGGRVQTTTYQRSLHYFPAPWVSR